MSSNPLPPASLEAPAERPTSVRWLMFSLACGTSWFLYVHRYTWNFIAPELKKEYGWDDAQVQGIYSLFNLTYGFGQIPSGMLCDYFGPHLFLGIIIIAWSIMLPLHAVPSQIGVSAARLAFGFSQAGAYPILAKVSQAWFPSSYRTVVQGWIATFFGRLGAALSPVIMATLLMDHYKLSWQLSLAVLSGAGVLYGVLFLTFFRNSPETDPRCNDLERAHILQGRLPVVTTERRIMPWGRALQNPSMVFFIGMQALVAGVDTFYSSLLGVYFASKGMSLTDAGWLASLPLFGGMLGGMAAAAAGDVIMRWTGNRRWGRSVIGIFSNVMACAMMLVMMQQQSAVAAALGLLAVKFFADMSQPTQWGACTDIGGRHFSATVFAIINTSGNLGGVLFPIVFGLILNSSKTLQIVDGVEQKDFTRLLLFAAGMYIAAAVCWIFIDCTRTLDDPADVSSPPNEPEASVS